MLRELIVGAWDLIRCELETDGEIGLPLGPDAVGLLTYARCGAMSVAIMRAGRRPFEVTDILLGSEAERASAASSYMSYAGRFTIDGERIRHLVEISLFPNWVGTVQERRVDLRGDALTLSTDPMSLGGRTSVARMKWSRRMR